MLKHKRHWFEYDDGTYYRNCSLIMQERRAALRHGRLWLESRLADEWEQTFRRGVQYKATLGKHDVSVGRHRQSFREFLPGLIGKVPDATIDEWDARPLLPGDPRFHWCYGGEA